MMKDMLHKKKLSNKIQKGNTNTQKKIVVNFFYFIFFFCCCVFVICCSRVRVDFQVLYPPLLGVPNKWLPRAKRPIMISYSTQFSKTLLPLILYIQSIQYMVEFLPYIFSSVSTHWQHLTLDGRQRWQNRILTLPQSPSYVLCMLDSTSS